MKKQLLINIGLVVLLCLTSNSLRAAENSIQTPSTETLKQRFAKYHHRNPQAFEALFKINTLVHDAPDSGIARYKRLQHTFALTGGDVDAPERNDLETIISEDANWFVSNKSSLDKSIRENAPRQAQSFLDLIKQEKLFPVGW